MQEDILKSIQDMMKTNSAEETSKKVDISQSAKSMADALRGDSSSSAKNSNITPEEPDASEDATINALDKVIDGLSNDEEEIEDNTNDTEDEDSEENSKNEEGGIHDILNSIEQAVKKHSNLQDNRDLKEEEVKLPSVEEKMPQQVENGREEEAEEATDIISDKSKNAVDAAIRHLNQVVHNYSMLKYISQEQLEALMIKAMKPYLTHWINKYLPEVVNNIVEKEIKTLTKKWNSE